MNIEEIKQNLKAKWNPTEKYQVPPETLRTLIQDLEYQRWWLHQSWVDPCPPISEMDTLWRNREHKAFICSLSRRQGKTTLIKRLLQDLPPKDCMIVSPYTFIQDVFKTESRLGCRLMLSSSVAAYHESHLHLFIDEFTAVSESDMDRIMGLTWKTISLFGTVTG